MQVHINTANNIKSSGQFEERLIQDIESELGRFADRITRVDVHLSDENSTKPGIDDKRCVVEVKMAGKPALAVTHHADSFNFAVTGAMDKIVTAIDAKIGKEHSRDSRDAMNIESLNDELADHEGVVAGERT